MSTAHVLWGGVAAGACGVLIWAIASGYSAEEENSLFPNLAQQSEEEHGLIPKLAQQSEDETRESLNRIAEIVSHSPFLYLTIFELAHNKPNPLLN